MYYMCNLLSMNFRTNDSGLELRMALVCGDNGAPARDLGPHKLGVHALARRAERHLLRYHARLGVVLLRDDLAPALTHVGRMTFAQTGSQLAVIYAGQNPPVTGTLLGYHTVAIMCAVAPALAVSCCVTTYSRACCA